MEDHCAVCGYDGRNHTLAEVRSTLAGFPDRVSALAGSVDDELLRRRPRPEEWSAIEYLGHLRDLIAYHRWLIERALAEDTPEFGVADPDEAVAAADYRSADLDDLLGQIRRRTERLVALLASIDDEAQRRPLIVASEGRIDIGVVARSAVHETHHHEQDLDRLLGG